MNPTPKKRSIDLTQKTDVKDTDVFLLSSHSGDYSSTFTNIVQLIKKLIIKRPIELSQKKDIKDTDVLLFSNKNQDYNSTFSNIITVVEQNIKNNIHTYIHNQTVGKIETFAINAIPDGYLKMDGGKYKMADYPLLWSKINGVLDGATDHKDGSFNLPNWTDYFLRYDPKRKLGKSQPWAIENITGRFWDLASSGSQHSSAMGTADGVFRTGSNRGDKAHKTSDRTSISSYDGISFDASRVVKVDKHKNETRPKNVSVIYAIKCDLK